MVMITCSKDLSLGPREIAKHVLLRPIPERNVELV
jgi:hypothetical protein